MTATTFQARRSDRAQRSAKSGRLRRQLAAVVVAIVSAGTLVFVPPAPAMATNHPPGGWSAVGSLAVPRIEHTATRLLDGKVLVTGGSRPNGNDPDIIEKTAEIFDPTVGTWTSAGSMTYSRKFHTATLLATGEVLVVGGFGRSDSQPEENFLDSAEIYDPVQKTWRLTGSLGANLKISERDLLIVSARAGHSATRLANGRVLVTGGKTPQLAGCHGGVNCYAEVFDPTATDPATQRMGSWNPTGSMVDRREYPHTATLLDTGPSSACGPHCGKVLVVGGDPVVAELFDPSATDVATGYVGTWTQTGSPISQRHQHRASAVLLPSGKVLFDSSDANEIFDPSTGTWARAAYSVAEPVGHTATLLPSGKVLVASIFSAEANDSNLYDPVTLAEAGGSAGAIAGGPMVVPRVRHSATLLQDGRVLVVGGQTDTSGTSPPAVTASAEIYSPKPFLSVSDVSVAEGTPDTPGHTPGQALFELSLSQPPAIDVTVSYSTQQGTARSDNNDYDHTTGSVTFIANQTRRVVVAVGVNDDRSTEPDEQFLLTVSNVPTAVFVTDGQGVATIVNDDPASGALLSVSDATVVEGVAGAFPRAIFTVSLSKPYAGPFTVRAVTAEATAHPLPHESDDYVHLNETIRFERDEMSKQVAVTIKGDNLDERDETFFLALEDSTGPQREKRQGLGVIVNDDALPAISIDDVSIAEGNSGTSEAYFTISLGHASFRQISVNYTTTDSTARSTNHGIFGPADYKAVSGVATFAAGATTSTVIVPVYGDTFKEQDEQFLVQLSNAVNATQVKRVGRATIRNDDPLVG